MFRSGKCDTDSNFPVCGWLPNREGGDKHNLGHKSVCVRLDHGTGRIVISSHYETYVCIYALPSLSVRAQTASLDVAHENASRRMTRRATENDAKGLNIIMFVRAMYASFLPTV